MKLIIQAPLYIDEPIRTLNGKQKNVNFSDYTLNGLHSEEQDQLLTDKNRKNVEPWINEKGLIIKKNSDKKSLLFYFFYI